MVRCYGSIPLLLPLKIFILIYSSLCVFSSTRWLGISVTARLSFFTSPHPEPLSRRWHRPGFVSPSISTLAEERGFLSTLLFHLHTFSLPFSTSSLFYEGTTSISNRNVLPFSFRLYKLVTVGLTCAEVQLALTQISMSNDDSGSEDDGFICLFFIWSQQSAETDFPH